MSYDTLELRGASPRPKNLIAEEVARLGLLPVLAAAIRAWWSRPRLPPNLPDHLRADVGLPPIDRSYTSIDFDRYT